MADDERAFRAEVGERILSRRQIAALQESLDALIRREDDDA